MRKLNGPSKIKWQMTVFSNSIDLFVSMNGSEIRLLQLMWFYSLGMQTLNQNSGDMEHFVHTKPRPGGTLALLQDFVFLKGK